MGIFRIKTNASTKRVQVYYSNFCKIPFSEISSILSGLRFHTSSGYGVVGFNFKIDRRAGSLCSCKSVFNH